ncbi:MAG TPA: SDR family NAD(P)-dependent oxidoreductase [Gaiellaceae bacterium]|jgi:NAD(P)-dependent dehydrogenase (short-subunit alcohol dehydrogenase family)|nr:SDR family NAD(P)-dependent oxidoreductase [Gaiellaceae bacterium]
MGRLLRKAPAGEPWSLGGKVAIVTGAGGGGTGRAIALRLAHEGATVVVNDIDEAGGAETVRRIQAVRGQAALAVKDVTREQEVEELIALAEGTFGGLDVLVNNAGGTPEPHFPDAMTEHWSRTLDLNLRGPMLAIERALPAMRKRGGGAIVTISSVAGLGYAPHASPEYSAAKAGLIRLTATLAPLKERANVRVTCVVPNWIGTEEVLAEIAAMTPEERAEVPETLTAPEEIADLVVELIENEGLAGRVVVWWTTKAPELIPVK